MRSKKRKISPVGEAEHTENQAPVPFFAKKLDPEALRSIRAGEDSDYLAERRDKLR